MFNLDTYLQSVLRRAYSRTPLYYRAINKAKRIEYVANRKRAFYTCASCGKSHFTRAEVQVDHIVPVIDPATGFTNITDFIARLFTDQLQVLCKPCHVKKSAEENKVRRGRKKGRESMPRVDRQ